MNLAQNGFVDAMDSSASSWDGNSIPYREDLLLDSNEIVDYLKTKWLEKDGLTSVENCQMQFLETCTKYMQMRLSMAIQKLEFLPAGNIIKVYMNWPLQ